MQFTNVFLATAFLFFTASATPMVPRSTCNPNFEGAVIKVSNGASGDIGAPNWPNAWHIQQNGQLIPSYIFKDANNNNRALARGDNGFLKMAPASDSGNDPGQLFDITCNFCSPAVSSLPPGNTVASGCTIKTPGSTSVCVSTSSSSPTEMRMLPCNPGAPFQTFSFLTF